MALRKARDAPEKAKVTSVVTKGKHGPYAVAFLESKRLKGSITFSLAPEIWSEKRQPSPGEFVALQGIHQKKGGWRSEEARFWTLSDDKH